MLPFDHIAPARRAILGFTARLGDEGHNGALAVALAQWAARDDTEAEPGVTRAGHAAVDEIDAMLRELHRLRTRLTGEIRERQDITMARADVLIAQRAAAQPDPEAWAFE